MNRSDKTAAIEALQQGFQTARNAFLVGFAGLTVSQVNELRRKVRSADSGYKVVKNRLALRAVAGTPLEPLQDRFQGPTAVAYNSGDPVALAKALAEFAKDNPALTLRVGVVEGRHLVEAEALEALARLPGLQELRGLLLSLIQAPAGKLVRLLAAPPTQLARVLGERQKTLSESAG